MARQVTAQVMNGDVSVIKNVEDVRDVRDKLGLDKNHSATINGEPADDGDEVEDYQFIAFAPKVKGGF